MKTHWFPLRRPAIKPSFLVGGTWTGGVPKLFFGVKNIFCGMFEEKNKPNLFVELLLLLGYFHTYSLCKNCIIYRYYLSLSLNSIYIYVYVYM